jgi:alpha-N-arabinofuranosidase
MTGLLRNSDLVVMSSYAPLFAKAGASQWAPDLIWFDNTHVYGTPSYHVQALYSRNRPDVILPVAIDGPPVTLPALSAASVSTYGAPARPPYRSGRLPTLFVAAGWDRQAGEVVLFVANPYAEARDATIALGGANHAATAGKAIVLASTTPDDVNSFEAPATVAPREETLPPGGQELSHRFPANSFTVLRLKMAQ